MKNKNFLQFHETFTDASNSVILINELLNKINALEEDEKKDILTSVLNKSLEQDKLYKSELKENLVYSKKRDAYTGEKRKVVYVKRVNREEKQYFNDTINSYNDEIINLINMNFDDFINYVSENVLIEDINYYILGFIKEIISYNKMADDAYQLNDTEFLKEIKEYINKLEEKIVYLNEFVGFDLDEEVIKEFNIVFLETNGGRACFLEDIDGYEEFFNSYAKLFKSLLIGKPLKKKYFTNVNNKLAGLCEARDPHGQTRIFYEKINEDTFVVIGGIIKKDFSSMGYKNSTTSTYTDYLNKKPYILANLNNESYLERQREYLDLVKEKLGLTNDSKKKIK